VDSEKDFAELTKDLTPTQKADLLSAMADAKIKKNDTELVSLLIFLKLTREDFGNIQADFNKSIQEAREVSEFVEKQSNTIKTAFTQFDSMYANKMENMSKTLDDTCEKVIKKLDKAYHEHRNLIHHLEYETKKVTWIRWRNMLIANIFICLVVATGVWFYRNYKENKEENKYIIINDAEIYNKKGNAVHIKFR